VLTLAPDAPSRRTAQALASAGSWPLTGAREPDALWGECRGSAATPYRTAVELSGPAYHCSCPSRKFPCKHALALLLLWADGEVKDSPGDPPAWAASWLAVRAAARAAAKEGPKGAPRGARGGGQPPREQGGSGGDRSPRESRVAVGLAELDRWLCDQVRQGLAGSQQAGYRHWDDIAARMVDAQAPGLAERLRGLALVPHSGPGWDGRLLEEYALLRLLAAAYGRQAELAPPLRDTVRARIGFTVRQADVLATGPRLRDRWQVLARRDLDHDRLRSRRMWLRGRTGGRYALVLSFAAAGQSLDDSLTVGTEVDAELAFYPAAVPMRALVAVRHDQTGASAPAGGTVAELLTSWAQALGADPWLDSWPAVLTATPARPGRPCLLDGRGDALPLHPGAGACWPLFALSGGGPLTVAGEWSPRGLWPLTAWDQTRAVPL
jgi:SWIM zinc finger